MTDLAHTVADWLLLTLRPSEGPLRIALSGGTTPRALYELLAQEPYRGLMPWDRIHVFWGDERFVPPDSDLSNYRMAYTALLGHVPIPPGNIHPVQTDDVTPEESARLYQATLARVYGSITLDPTRPLFDVNLLGLGTNGHTASLFPGTPALTEQTAWALAVTPEGEPTRITLTYPALNSSRHVAFMVAGADKRDVLARVRAHDPAEPASFIAPVGQLHWFVDKAASGA